MTEELIKHHKRAISSLELIPSEGGRFEVTVDGKLVFSKLKEGRFPDPSEILAITKAKKSR
ncbi:MAG: SelT/SelW/SelH family protein [Planctomycetes bacterium]|nr:SelT/SelW/SelH family protein [Planctomycetota bacterium]MBI3845768.1 SelT/SelW/SelH family protein [Planctomycetota bacterium]